MKTLKEFVNENKSLVNFVSDDLYDIIKHRNIDDIEDMIYEFLYKSMKRLKSTDFREKIMNAIKRAEKIDMSTL